MQDPKCQFALKEFDGTKRGQDAFEREIRMLQHLRPANHPHIVMHITAWKSRKGRQSYILYPMAKYHLRSLLAGKPLVLNRDGMLWFLRQVKGLADATYSIHYLKKETVNLYRGGGTKEPENVKMVFDEKFSIGEDKWCSHQDIKPENILVFEKLKGHHPFFKLSDLGSGYFNDAKGSEDISEAVKTAQGTRVYYGPEIDQISERKGVSRPFDMWALGCCYLELLIWLFKPWTQSDFADKRLASERVDDIQFQEASYWSKTSDGRYDRKSAVNEVIAKLRKKHCASMPAFLQLIDIIEKLLDVEPLKRKKSEQLLEDLKELYNRTEAELGVDPNRYVDQYRTNHPERAEQLQKETSPPVRSGHSPSPSRELKQTGLGATEPASQPSHGGPSDHGTQQPTPERVEDDFEALRQEAQNEAARAEGTQPPSTLNTGPNPPS